MKKRYIYIVCAVLLCSLLTVLMLPQLVEEAKPRQQAIDKAIYYLKQTDEPYAMLWLDVMHRRFGIEEFANALEQYDRLLAESPTPIMRIFRRIADYNNPLQTSDIDSVNDQLDYITVPALYCDRVKPPDNYPTTLNKAISIGRYPLTHVLLACIWMENNKYENPLSNDTIKSVYHATAELINDDPTVDDIELEAAAFLALSGQINLVDDTFLDKVVKNQNADGSWSEFGDKPGDSYWHTTVLGLLFLLHVENPADSYPPVLATQ